MKPPVEAPTSRQILPPTEMFQKPTAASSFSPPRETNLGRDSTLMSEFSGKREPGLIREGCWRVPVFASETFTCPARISACALLRDSARPFSIRSMSRRFLEIFPVRFCMKRMPHWLQGRVATRPYELDLNLCVVFGKKTFYFFGDFSRREALFVP